MSDAPDPASIYLDQVERAAPALAKALRGVGRLSRGAAAEAVAAAGALIPLALARHARRRPDAAGATRALLEKYGPGDALADPAGSVRRRWPSPDLTPRLGGLLGDDGPRAAAWVARRTGDDVVEVGRALAASAPTVLAAIALAADLPGFEAWLGALGPEPLAEPDRLSAPGSLAAAWFSSLRSRAFPWWTRVLP